MTERNEFHSTDVVTPQQDFIPELAPKPTTGAIPPSLPSEKDITSPSTFNGVPVPTAAPSTTDGTDSPAPEVPGAFRELAEQGSVTTPLEHVPEVKEALEYVKQNLPSKEDVSRTMGSIGESMSGVVGKVWTYLRKHHFYFSSLSVVAF